jgi:hypothetical protein
VRPRGPAAAGEPGGEEFWQCSRHGGTLGRRGKERKAFFFEKKKQKTFAYGLGVLTEQEFFGSFSKKEPLPFLPA